MSERHLLVVRHGQTEANATGVLQGHQPTALNALGRQQARLVAARLAAWQPRVSAIVTSDLPRAAQTAEPIAAACRAPVVADADWRERGLGEMEGKTIGEHDAWRAVSGSFDPPGAESVAELEARVRRALLAAFGHAPAAAVVAVVTHGGPVRAILRMLGDGRLPLAGGHEAPALVQIINCSIMDLVESSGRWSVACVNDAAHLEPPDSTDRDAG
ncbi:MAG TPA: histidine phosphatase family protein [Kofleriaceae bacterium]|nr:histidine phosphatase family protein [Kofleriaceae bacterium]